MLAYIFSIVAAFICSTTLRFVFSVGVSSFVLLEKSRFRIVNFWIFEALLGQHLPSALVRVSAS